MVQRSVLRVSANLVSLFIKGVIRQFSMSARPLQMSVEEFRSLDFIAGLDKAGWIRPVIIGVGVQFDSLFSGDKRFQLTGADHRVGVYRVGEMEIEVYNLSKTYPFNSVFIIDAENFGNLRLLAPEGQESDSISGYVRASYTEQTIRSGEMFLDFVFSVQYELRLVANPRIIRIDLR